MNALITVLMLLVIMLLLFKEVSSPGVIFTGVPIIACFLMGFSGREIVGFISSGLQTVSGTLFLMVFAVLYFGLLHEAGIFRIMVRKVLRLLKNSVTGTLIITAIISMLTQLDGSGATTALCTIPPLKPIYERQHIRREALLLIESLGSGVMCILPWAPAIVEVSAYTETDVMEIFYFLIPVFVFSIFLVFVWSFAVSKIESKHGAGLSDEEFAQLQSELGNDESYPLGTKVAIFDSVFTILMLAALLAGLVPSNLAFGIGFPFLLLVHYRADKKAQMEYFRQQAPTALNLAFTMLGIGVLVGINRGTGVLEEMAAWLSQNAPSQILSHLPILFCAVSLLLTITISNSKNSILLPAVIPMVTAFGFTPVQVTACVFATGVIGANVSLFNASPYLALGLADVEMGKHLRYSLLPVYGFSLTMLAFMVLTGMLPL